MEWKQRYTILNPNVIPKTGFIDPKKACEKILSSLPFNPEVYRYGHTKLFFKAGIIGALEDLRDDKIAQFRVVKMAYPGYAKKLRFSIELKSNFDV